MQGEDFYKTLLNSLLFLPKIFTNIFTGKMILPMVLPVYQWYGKFSKFSTLVDMSELCKARCLNLSTCITSIHIID